MKLKKIASLALAGVMAVSMLAGCATNKPEEKPGEGEGTVTTTGYSATLEDAMDLTEKQAEYISFADNAADQAALQKAVASLSNSSLAGMAQNNQLKLVSDITSKPDVTDMHTDLIADLGTVKGWNLDLGCATLANVASHIDLNSPDVRGGVLYVVNSGVSTEAALKDVAEALQGYMPYLVESAKTSTTSNTNIVTYHYTYTMSASVVTRELPASYTGATNAATFILVTTTRTVA